MFVGQVRPGRSFVQAHLFNSELNIRLKFGPRPRLYVKYQFSFVIYLLVWTGPLRTHGPNLMSGVD